jgi:hypothetical protein
MSLWVLKGAGAGRASYGSYHLMTDVLAFVQSCRYIGIGGISKMLVDLSSTRFVHHD